MRSARLVLSLVKLGVLLLVVSGLLVMNQTRVQDLTPALTKSSSACLAEVWD